MRGGKREGSGRKPVGNASRKRTITVRMTEEEYLILKRAAEAVGMSVSQFLRKLISDNTR